MRPPNRSPFPDLELLLDETNRLLAMNGLPTCHELAPVADGDTANPNVIAYSSEGKYVVKVTQRHPDTLDHQLEVANALRVRTKLPIPQHFCCATERSGLPLMIMEWLPGEQLRTVLANAQQEDLKKLCAKVATCMAIFHEPDHLGLVPEEEGRFSGWLYGRTMATLQELAGEQLRSKDHKLDADGIRRYLEARMSRVTVPAIPSLAKADQDLRDFLADPGGLEITGMLDWERVTRGDGIYAITLIFLRLWLNAKLDGWPAFLATYNRLATVRAEQCPQAEFYLMCRAALAYRFNDGAREILDLLLRGQRLPFDSDPAT